MRLCFLIVKHSQKSITPGFNRILLPAILLDYYQTYPMIMICHQNNLSRLWLLLLNVWKFWNNQKHHHLCCKHSSIHLDNFLKLYLPLLATLSIKGEFHLDWIMSMMRGDILSSNIKMWKISSAGKKLLMNNPQYQLFLDQVLQNLQMRYQT